MSLKDTAQRIDRRFGITAAGSSIRVEVMAGLTTFFAMAYILMVNAGMLSAIPGVSYGAIYIATALSAVVGTVCIGLLANLPLAQASGMGLNAYFTYTVVLGMGFTYANALVLVLLDGVLFILLTVTGLRRMIFQAIPRTVRIAIPAGIGLFIAFLGMQNAGLIVQDGATLVGLTSFNVLQGSWGGMMPVVVTLLSLLLIFILSHHQVRGAVLIGILGGAGMYYALGYATVPGFSAALTLTSPGEAFRDFFQLSFLKVLTEGFNFLPYAEAHGVAATVLGIGTSALALCMVDMFDTIGTLYGACARGHMLTPEGEVPRMNRAMLSDAIATTAGALCGTSTVSTFVESASGVAEGGRTGLTSLVTAALFLLAMFLSPVAALIPSCATSAALIYVGVLMLSGIREIEWSDLSEALPAFLTMVMMPFTCNISFGIAFGLISYAVLRLCTGRRREVRAGTWVIALLFLVMLLLTH